MGFVCMCLCALRALNKISSVYSFYRMCCVKTDFVNGKENSVLGHAVLKPTSLSYLP